MHSDMALHGNSCLTEYVQERKVLNIK